MIREITVAHLQHMAEHPVSAVVMAVVKIMALDRSPEPRPAGVALRIFKPFKRMAPREKSS
jgi:hypothetical protein